MFVLVRMQLCNR